jgi:hypothetical protein
MITLMPAITPVLALRAQTTAAVAQNGSPDQYTPGSASQRPVGYQQMLAATQKQSAPAYTAQDVLGAVQKDDYAKLDQVMQGMTGAQRLQAFADLRQNHKKDYQGFLADIRANKVESQQAKVGVSLDLLKTTRWAQKGEGKDIVKHLESQYGKGFIHTPADLGGPGSKVNLNPTLGAGMNGIKSDSILNLRADVATSPEAAASVLAHEGQHSWRASQGTMKRSLAEEVDANTVQAQVWKEFGKEKYQSKGISPATVRTMDSIAQQDTPTKMLNYVATRYTEDYASQGQTSAARGVLADWGTAYLNQNQQPLKEMSTPDMERFLDTVKTLSGEKADVWGPVLQTELDRRSARL